MTVLRQIWTMSAVYLVFLTNELTSDLDWIKLEENTFSKQTSFLQWSGVFTIIGYITSSILMDRVGRRSTYILGISTGVASCLMLNSDNLQTELTGRALTKLCFGVTSILGIIIIGEYTSPKYRLLFLNLTTTSMYVGQLCSQVMSRHFQWSTIVNISLLIRVITLAITLTWPKSPFWLALKERYAESDASFDYLRGIDKDSKREKNDLFHRKRKEHKSLMECAIEFLSKEFKRPLTVVIFGTILVEVSGRNYLPMFAANFIAITSVELSNLSISIIITVSSITSCTLLGIFRYRNLLLTAGFSSICAMIIESVYIFLYKKSIVTNYSWFGTSCIILHVIVSNLGVSSIPIALIGEMFSLDQKPAANLLSGLITSAVSWITLKMASNFLISLHVYGTLVIFALILTICLLFLFVILPETKGRTLLEIEEFYKNGCFNDDGLDEEIRLTQT